jgi:hypothetical protein
VCYIGWPHNPHCIHNCQEKFHQLLQQINNQLEILQCDILHNVPVFADQDSKCNNTDINQNTMGDNDISMGKPDRHTSELSDIYKQKKESE